MLTPEEQSAFVQSVENVQQAASAHLGAQRSEQSVITFVRNLHQAVDRAVDAAAHRGARIDCKAGCSHCCSARVEAIAPEIFQIARELERREPAELAQIVGRLQAHATAPDSQSLPWNQRESCPFLQDRLCSIYQVRPAACRKAHSSDVTECEAHAPAIPQDRETALHAEALLIGTTGAYRQRGFDASSYELVRAVLIALSDPSAQARWYGGEPVFDPGGAAPANAMDDAS